MSSIASHGSVLLLSLLGLAACSDDDPGGTGGGPGASSSGAGASAGSGGSGAEGGSGASGGSGAAGGGATGGPQLVAAFDQLPEGLALDPANGRALVGFATTGEIVAVDLGDATITPFGNVPAPPPDGFMTGLAIGPDGSVFAALVSSNPGAAAGIYKLPAAGGAGVLFASDALMTFPNGIVVRDDGGLLVTDSAAGAVFATDAAGAVNLWQQAPELTGQNDACGAALNAFDIGANGIAQIGDDVFVANTDKGSIVRIPVERDGTAGVPEVFVGPDCAVLGGADGLAANADGALFLAVNYQDRLVRIAPDATVTELAEGEPLDFPASTAVFDTGGVGTLFVTSFALDTAMAGDPPSPALLALPLVR